MTEQDICVAFFHAVRDSYELCEDRTNDGVAYLHGMYDMAAMLVDELKEKQEIAGSRFKGVLDC